VRIDDVLTLEQYSLPQAEKERMLLARLRDLTGLHAERSEAYGRILSGLGLGPEGVRSLDDVPMLPIGLFKTHVLRSIPEERVFKVVTSSGTTGAAVSRVYLDAAATQLQTRTLASIMKHWLGAARLPMIVVEARSILGNRRTLPARAAGIVGMMTFGRDHFFALDDELRLRHDDLALWLAKHAGSAILVFGYTFTVWEQFLEALSPGEIDLSNAVLIHSGGWKKLAERAVSNAAYKARLERVTGLRRVHNFYGMAEQIGTAFVECEHGFLHAPNAADIVVRDPSTWAAAAPGEVGVAHMLSALPESYPGHSILTEDLARVEAVDDCPCGRRGKAVSIVGRVPEAELRGCSDVYAQIHAMRPAAA
jgi:phenylacetate-coenzyme A ligase PaaK-like adenylate-forming protein